MKNFKKLLVCLTAFSLVAAAPLTALAEVITYNSDDPNLPIAFQGGPNTITSTFTIDDDRTIFDLDVSISMETGFFSDLTGSLIAPDGTIVSLFFFDGPNQDTANFTLDDEAANSIAGQDAFFALTGTYSPLGSLSDFDGDLLTGDWTLSLTDSEDFFVTEGRDLNTLISWSITAEVPEPGVLTLVLTGLLGLMIARRRSRSQFGA